MSSTWPTKSRNSQVKSSARGAVRCGKPSSGARAKASLKKISPHTPPHPLDFCLRTQKVQPLRHAMPLESELGLTPSHLCETHPRLLPPVTRLQRVWSPPLKSSRRISLVLSRGLSSFTANQSSCSPSHPLSKQSDSSQASKHLIVSTGQPFTNQIHSHPISP